MNILWKIAHLLTIQGVLKKSGRFFDILEHIIFANSVSVQTSIGKETFFIIWV